MLFDLGGCVGIGVGTNISFGSLYGPHIELNETPGGENGMRYQIMRGTSVQTANREGSRVLHILRVQRPQETMSQDSERGLENLLGERDSLAFGGANIRMIENRGVVELSVKMMVLDVGGDLPLWLWKEVERRCLLREEGALGGLYDGCCGNDNEG
ncbi:uncharacterized protein HKW66_Vig0251520 [Vigna angularis]|uniref:Uncharacterized protein n=1 Tax=Phaseolus angularis TaxID=3914 RepID=A0A8T0JMP6_PHAAN|nr:uncharacterized protein HKW66_Vig0251520 [Vigna angularis]